MVDITPLRAQRSITGNSPIATDDGRPTKSTRAEVEMQQLADFDMTAQAEHVQARDAKLAQRSLAQRRAARDERKEEVAGVRNETDEPSQGDDGVATTRSSRSGSILNDSERPSRPSRGEFEEAELDRLRLALRDSRAGLSADELADLEKKHAASINVGMDVAELFQQPSQELRRNLSAMSLVMTGAEFGKQDKPLDASRLFDHLEKTFGSDGLDRALVDLRQVVTLEMRQRLLDAPGPQSQKAFELGSAYHALMSTRAIAEDLRVRLSDMDVMPRMSRSESGRYLLKAPFIDDRSAAAFVSRLVTLDALARRKSAAARRAIRTAVGDLPTTLWPTEGIQQRQSLLSAMDELAINDDRPDDDRPLRESDASLQKRKNLEQLLAKSGGG